MGRWLFEFKYLRGRAPWNSGIVPPEVVAEVEAAPSPGRALDLGCGSGTSCIYLARHGWEAVGVDFSALAIRQARRKARRAGLRIAFYRADISNLSFLDGPFDLALDIGCLHSVPLEKRSQVAAEVARLVRPAGLYMLYAFLPRPGHRAPGLAPSQVIDLFGGAFAIERQEQGKDPNGRASAWYWLRRR